MNTQFRILIILVGITAASLDVAAKPWRGIEPLRSTKADVIRLFNQCNDDLRICSFELEHEHVSIHFSSPLRTRDERYMCVGDLALGTVLRIEVVPKGSPRFNRWDFGQSSFKRFDPSPRRTGNYKAYLDKKSGLLINTREGKVVEMIYFAAAADTNLCQSYYTNPDHFISVEPLGMPPIISLDCPTTAQDSKITLTAHTFDDPELQFLWTVSQGKVLRGQYTDTITVDATGLSGQTIKVMVEVVHKSGLAAAATCDIGIHSL
jgi:hypothetical protein